MNRDPIDVFLRKYTEGEPRKVWKCATSTPGCRGCIFSTNSRVDVVGLAYRCNRRNLTTRGHKLNDLFIPQNFEDWRCGVSQFRYAPSRQESQSDKDDERLARIAARREAQRVRNEAIIDLYERGVSVREICTRLKAVKSTVYNIIKENKNLNLNGKSK